MDRLLIASLRLPPIAGGQAQVAWDIAKRLVNKFEVHIVTTGGNCTYFKEDVNVHSIPRLPYLTLSYSGIFRNKIDKILREVSPDIIHSHIVLPWGYVFGKADACRVVTCSGSDVFPEKQYPLRFFLISALRHADAITTGSRWLSEYVRRIYGVQCMPVPSGVDVSIFRPLQSTNRRENVVLFVGRFVKMKGVLDLIEVAKQLSRYEFWFVGDPRQKGSIRIPSLPNVKVVGFVGDRRKLASYYNKATLCVFPSHRENFPNVGLEAMACGKAVIASRIGFSEYIRSGCDGLLIGPRDVEGLASSITYLMENRDIRRDLEANALKKAIRYDWDVIVQEYQDLYKRLIQQVCTFRNSASML